MFSDNFITENHEGELADEEAEDHKPLSEKSCSKQPSHPQFVPIKCFRETHLPPELRDNAGATCNKILCQAKLTVMGRGGFISKDQLEDFPDFPYKGSSVLPNGTGSITNVSNTEEPDDDKVILEDKTHFGSLREPVASVLVQGDGLTSTWLLKGGHHSNSCSTAVCYALFCYETPTCSGSRKAVVMCGGPGLMTGYIRYGKNGFEPGINQSSSLANARNSYE
ncbi:hypothetical protein PoB_000106000 [Plakobranchus ocellatus]|uniref:Uncharacterized protein n=1 Tax=Plakobranchus ocellatus TaxID=259542 RepID=A0AAV3XUQ4_9GAST|nr:hypothetical protein PoB_000106000 [Plakobranchus ocellatus]